MKPSKVDLDSVPFECKPAKTASLAFLKPYQVSMIDEALSSLGEFGEVRLVVEKGRLRFLVMQRSFDVLKLDAQTLKEV